MITDLQPEHERLKYIPLPVKLPPPKKLHTIFKINVIAHLKFGKFSFHLLAFT